MRDRRDLSQPPRCPVLGFDREGAPLDWIDRGLIEKIQAIRASAHVLEGASLHEIPADSYAWLQVVKHYLSEADRHRHNRQSLSQEVISGGHN